MRVATHVDQCSIIRRGETLHSYQEVRSFTRNTLKRGHTPVVIGCDSVIAIPVQKGAQLIMDPHVVWFGATPSYNADRTGPVDESALYLLRHPTPWWPRCDYSSITFINLGDELEPETRKRMTDDGIQFWLPERGRSCHVHVDMSVRPGSAVFDLLNELPSVVAWSLNRGCDEDSVHVMLEYISLRGDEW